MKLYICNETGWDTWDGAPVHLVRKAESPPAMPDMVEIEHAVTGERYVIHRSNLSAARPGMVHALKALTGLREGLKTLRAGMAPVMEKLGISE